MRINGKPASDAGALTALVAADGSTGGFIKDSQAGNLPATATNDDATAGTVGEYNYTDTLTGAATVTITNASPAVVTYTAHGLRAGACIRFTTTGALPAGLTADVNYFVLATGLTANTFQVATAPFGTAINTSDAGSGVHTGNQRATLTTATQQNVAGISLTAGDWDVWGMVGFIPAGTTTMTRLMASVSTTSATLGADPGSYQQIRAAFNVGEGQTLATPVQRISLASTTTIYLVSLTAFGVSTMSAYGRIAARRAR